MNGDTITDIDLDFAGTASRSTRYISKKTGRHMGTTYYDIENEALTEQDVDCEYFDCGTPEKLKLARDHFEK